MCSPWPFFGHSGHIDHSSAIVLTLECFCVMAAGSRDGGWEYDHRGVYVCAEGERGVYVCVEGERGVIIEIWVILPQIKFSVI